MNERSDDSRTSAKHPTTVERASERELVVTRTVDAPARVVFEAWTSSELMAQWWVPKSLGMTLRSCEIDARVGGGYRFVFVCGDGPPMAFFGRYLEAEPPTRLVWTNDEAGADGPVTTLTLEERDGATRVVLRDVYPTKEALDAAMDSGEKSCMGETFDQLDALLDARDPRRS